MGGMMSRAKKSIRIGCGVHTYNNLRTPEAEVGGS
jgi:hypothetical protein